MAKTHQLFRQRRSGILLHPSSLPAASKGGALGDDAIQFMDFLAESGFSIWQMLPVNSTDHSGSPYHGTSVHAGNSSLINLQHLVARGWLRDANYTAGDDDGTQIIKILHTARIGFQKAATEMDLAAYQTFRREHSYWLDDYSLYSVIKDQHEQQPWWQWPQALRNRDKSTIKQLRAENAELLEDYCFEQYVFFSQWKELQQAAHDRGILLLGDLPILIAHDSVDVWSHPEYFKLDAEGHPVVVAGVPPDYFSATGQRWGNPLYEWRRFAENGYSWWIERLRTQLQLFDMVRIDHFRGFIGLWEIDANCQTAQQGQWQPVPGRELFKVLRNEFGKLPLIAEDLGIISPEVEKLRDDFRLPGMKVLQFAFDSDEKNPYLPHNHVVNSVVYTGTHDNDTTVGWFYGLNEDQQRRVLDYLRFPVDPMPWPLIYTAMRSVSRIAIVPMQDVLALDGSHRMNTPGTITGNWRWRFDWEWIPSDLKYKLYHLNRLYGRI